VAIGALHSKNVMHRHLNPESIIIENDGYIKLIGFHNATRFSEDMFVKGNPPVELLE